MAAVKCKDVQNRKTLGGTLMEKYSKINVQETPRTELHDALGLSGAEISINSLEKGTETPFFHAHRKNEEIYGVISGKGSIKLDDEELPLEAGDWVRVAPPVIRCMAAAKDTAIRYICIQARAGSLEEFTMGDAYLKK